ncbi:MAG: ketopantoate reductase family protein [Asgard group archaeon]|nr:ketopantoate reductase family protein [Asgard group archaeon]
MINKNGELKVNNDSSSNGDVLIIGAGAIGGLTGAILHQANIDVCLINRKSEHYEKVKSEGLLIEGQNERIKVPIKSSVKELDKKYKHVLIVVKNTSTEQVMKDIKNVLLKDSLVYSMQNGFGNTDVMAKYLPRNQIIAGVVGWGATKIEPGVIRITSRTGDFVIGFEQQKSTNDSRLFEIRKWLSLWKPTIVTDNILGFRWSKLIVNSIIAPLGGLLGLTLGELMGDSRINKTMTDLKEEGLYVADKLQIKLEKVDNMNVRSFFYRPKADDGFFKRAKNSLVSSIINRVGAKRHGKIRSSLLWDLENGRKTEVDYLNGYIERKGKELGFETSINSFLVKAIHEIESGKRDIGLHNLPELEAAAELSREKIKEYK